MAAYSPDLNPMDYSIWGIAVLRVGKTASSDVDELKVKISDVMANLLPQTVASACARFLPKCKAVVEKNGGFIEYLAALHQDENFKVCNTFLLLS